MIAGLEKDEEEARANRKAHQQREMTLHGWSAAIGNSKPADPAEGSAADLAPVRAKVARYTKACTK